jgi:bacillithiol biosynthesis cysteine-adding enzyme BshC
VSAAPRVDAVRLEAMPGDGGDPFVRRYAAGDPAVAEFFGPRPAALDASLDGVRRGSLLDRGARRALVEALRAQPGAIPEAPAQRDAIAALEEEATLAVVTGQQPGLFLGPLLTLHKAVSAIALARRLSSRHGRAVVPVFWIVAEDDDPSEIDALSIAAKAGVETVRLFPGGAPAERRTFAALSLGDAFERARAETVALLPAGGASARLAERLADASRLGTPVASFARLLGALLGPLGLVVADPSDPALKALLAPIFRREAGDPLATARAAAGAASRLEALGLRAQVRPDPSQPAFFVLEGGRRARPAAASAASLASHPERLVPNVLLRPVCQDYLFPAVATVAGPAEVAYLGQTGEAYARHGVPRPVVAPRLSALLVEPEVARVLDRHAIDLAVLRRAPSALAAPSADPPELSALERPSADLDAALGRLEERLAGDAPPLAAMVAGARRKVAFEVQRVRERGRKELDRASEDFRRQAARARDRLFPDGRLQERVLSPLPFLARWEALPESLAALYDPLDARPVIVRLPSEGPG